MGVITLGTLRLSTTYTTPAAQAHNTQEKYTVLLAGVVPSSAPSVSCEHSMPDGVTVAGFVAPDGKLGVIVTNLSGQTLPAGQVITIRVRQ